MDNPGREMSEAGQSQEGSFAKDHLERREKEVAETVSFNASKNQHFCFLSEAVEIWYAIRYEPLETNSGCPPLLPNQYPGHIQDISRTWKKYPGLEFK